MRSFGRGTLLTANCGSFPAPKVLISTSGATSTSTVGPTAPYLRLRLTERLIGYSLVFPAMPYSESPGAAATKYGLHGPRLPAVGLLARRCRGAETTAQP